MTIGDLITSALRDLGIVDLTATPESALSDLALAIVNRVLDRWNAEHGALYAETHSALLALTAGLNPHTVGVSGDSPTWAVSTVRPAEVLGVRVTADDGETYLPLMRRNAAWWQSERAPGTQSDYPTDFYYEPTWPNGSLYLFPEPGSSAMKVQLWYAVPLAQVEASTVLSVPPAYRDALDLTLKERLIALPIFASKATPGLADEARKARGVAFAKNLPTMEITTDDGLGGGGRGSFRSELGPYSLMGY